MAIGYDASLPLRYDPIDGFYVLNKTVNSNVKQNLKMLILTAPGERVMLPEYGVGLRHYLFENNPEREIMSKIQEQMIRYLPELQVLSAQVKKDQDIPNRFGQRNTLFVRIVYKIPGVDVIQTFDLLEQNIL
jgi:hypothetical protein